MALILEEPLDTWLPKIIIENVQKRSGQTITATEFNNWFNLLIIQGNYNSRAITSIVKRMLEGISPYEIAVENGFVGTEVEWLTSLNGEQGAPGLSAYEEAVAHGYVGTYEDWATNEHTVVLDQYADNIEQYAEYIEQYSNEIRVAIENLIGNTTGINDTTASILTAYSSVKTQSLLDGVQAHISNPNSLINGDFKVWQRGTSFTDQYNFSYNADRWVCQSSTPCTIEKVSNGLKITSTGTEPYGIAQRIEEDPLLIGKSLSLSISVDGIIYTTQGTLLSSANVAMEYPNLVMYFGNGAGMYNYVTILFKDGASNHTVNWVKLEVNNCVTPFIPKTYAEELRDCYRYYRRINAINSASRFGFGYTYTSTLTPCDIHVPVPMRTAYPVLTYSSASHFGISAGSGFHTVTNMEASHGGTNLASIAIMVTANIGSTPMAQYAILMANTANAWIAFETEL